MPPVALPPSTGISSFTLQVPSIRESVAFYRDLLGFVVTEVGSSRTGLSAEQKEEPFVFLVEKGDATPRPRGTTGLFHAAYLFPNRRELARVYRRLYEHGWPFQGFADHGVSEALYLTDPHGNGLELYADRPRAQWPHRNGALHMVTEPLDLDSLLAELDQNDHESPDGGLTRIGHLHLNVSDLKKAKRFYHELLAFTLTQETIPGALFVAAGDYHHHLGLNIWNGPGAPSSPPDAIGLIQFDIGVPDAGVIAQLADRLHEEGVTLAAWPNGFRTTDFDGLAMVIHH
jgi:catechol 2,3-dioxygenase